MPKFKVTNKEDISTKPAAVRWLWGLLNKMSEGSDAFVSDHALVVTAGDGPQERTPKVLKLDALETKAVTEYSIVDGPDPDNVTTATGTVFSIYQLLELAYAKGRADEAVALSKGLSKAAKVKEEEEEEEGEDDIDLGDEAPEVDNLDEEEDDEEDGEEFDSDDENDD